MFKMLKIIGIISCLVYILESREIGTPVYSNVNTVQEEPNIISREEWDARFPQGTILKLSQNPPSYIVVHHSATGSCTSQVVCEAKIRSIQNYHMDEKEWNDIGYNFLIGEDGNIYEGRGWGKRGTNAPNFNAKSIGICIIGDFRDREPNSAAINALKTLIAHGVTLNNIKNDYHLIGHRQSSKTSCPGNKLFDLIKTFPHWEPNQVFKM